MTLIDIQRRLSEVGRIRIGQKVPTSGGSSRPAKLETFRLTSPDRARIDAATTLYGGTVAPWEAPAGKQWEVITDATTLPVIVPPTAMAFSQHYEVWSAGGCAVRCDGQWDTISDKPCHCDPDERACKPHTRLSVMLSEVPGLGVWRLDTGGFHAAAELQGAVQIVELAARQGTGLLPASLRLEQRTVKRPGPDGKPQTRRFAVPVLDIEVTPAQLLAGTGAPQLASGAGGGDVVALPAPEPPRLLTPVPDSVPERPVGSIRDQIEAVAEIERVRRGSVPVTPTGLDPRPAAAPVETAVVVPAGVDDAWAELAQVLGDPPGDGDTMDPMRDRLRRLFALMETVGLWPLRPSGQDALHAALEAHYGVQHLADLRKPNLVAFCAKTWDAARAAYAADGTEPTDA